MATVYRAFDPVFKREVALKVLPRELLHDPAFRARFEREAQTIASLEHTAIVPVHDVGEADGQPYIVMRLMSGGSLADRLAAGPLTLAQEGELVSHIMGALRRNDVDCVNMELAPPFLQFRILRDGVLVLDRNPVRRVSFTARAWSTYFDLQPALDTYYGLTRAR